MAKIITLTQNRDFLRLYKRGKSLVHPLLVTYAVPSRLGHSRIGITTSKKIGGAVQRNRARRIIKEAYRQLCVQGLAPQKSWDLVFVARARTPLANMDDAYRAMKKHFEQLT